MNIKITESMLRSASSSEIFARGYDLYQSSAIYDIFQQHNRITGKCKGGSAPYYELRLQLDEGGIREALCTCPFDGGGYCKHIIALGLAYIHDPSDFVEQKDVKTLLSQLNKEDLVNLVHKLVESHPDLYPWVETSVSISPCISTRRQPGKQQNTSVSKTEYTKRVRSILRSLSGYRASETYWMMSGLVSQLNQIRDAAYQFRQAGDAQGALIILTALLTEISDHFDELDDSDGELGDFVKRKPGDAAHLNRSMSHTSNKAPCRRMRCAHPIIVEC